MCPTVCVFILLGTYLTLNSSWPSSQMDRSHTNDCLCVGKYRKSPSCFFNVRRILSIICGHFSIQRALMEEFFIDVKCFFYYSSCQWVNRKGFTVRGTTTGHIVVDWLTWTILKFDNSPRSVIMPKNVAGSFWIKHCWILDCWSNKRHFNVLVGLFKCSVSAFLDHHLLRNE